MYEGKSESSASLFTLTISTTTVSYVYTTVDDESSSLKNTLTPLLLRKEIRSARVRNFTKEEFNNCRLSLEGLLGVVSFDLDVVARADGDVVFESAVERVLVSVLERVLTVGVAVVEISLGLVASVEIVMSTFALAVSSKERRRRRPDNVRLKL